MLLLYSKERKMRTVPLTRNKKQEIGRFTRKIQKTAVRALGIRTEIMINDDDNVVGNFIESTRLLADSLIDVIGGEEINCENKFMVNVGSKTNEKELMLWLRAKLEAKITEFYLDRAKKVAIFTATAEEGKKG